MAFLNIEKISITIRDNKIFYITLIIEMDAKNWSIFIIIKTYKSLSLIDVDS